MAREDQDFSMHAGDTKQLNIAVVDEAGAPLSMTGASAIWAMTNRPGGDIIVQKDTTGGGVTIVNIDATNDGLQVDIDPADTEGLAPGTFYHEAEVTDTSSNVVTVTTGEVTLKPSSI